VTRQETTFTRTISRNQRLQTKTPEKEHKIWPARLSVKVVSKLMSWFSPSFSGALVNATALTLLLGSSARKNYLVAAFQLTLPDPCPVSSQKLCAFHSSWWHYRFRHRASYTLQSRFLLFRSTNRLIKTFSDGPRNNMWCKWLE